MEGGCSEAHSPASQWKEGAVRHLALGCCGMEIDSWVVSAKRVISAEIDKNCNQICLQSNPGQSWRLPNIPIMTRKSQPLVLLQDL